MNLFPSPPLLVITDRRQTGERSLEWVLAAVLEGGARWISLREKDLSAADRLDMLRRFKKLADAADARLMVHDDIEAALSLELYGIHLPARSDVMHARRRLGESALVGSSAHSAAEISRAGADYVTMSPIFISASKPGYGPAIGVAGISAAVAASSVPVIALGGIETPQAIADCLAAGAFGVAIMGALMRASDPAKAVATLLTGMAGD